METPPPLPQSRSAPAAFSPLAESQRHELLDVVRGFAIFGIFLVNMIGFKTPFITTAAVGELWHSGTVNQWTVVVIEVFATFTFVPIFSLVFGIGIALQYGRSQALNRPFRGFFFRRMLVLFVLGIMHGVLLWAGDILAIYALCGIFALIFLGLRPVVLAGWAVGFYLFSLLSIGALMYMYAAYGDDTEWWVSMGEWWFEAYSEGDWGEILLARLAEWGFMWMSAITYFLSFVFALILLGMIIGSTGTLEKLDRWRPRLCLFAATGIPCGILLNGIWVAPYIDVDSVTYSDRDPWPSQPDGYGPSLERIVPAAYADDPGNWRASRQDGGTPGYIEATQPFFSFDTWLAQHQLSGPDADPGADPDGDGIANLLEYAFDLDPAFASLAGLPVFGQVSEEDGDYLTITFHRRIGVTDIQYRPEFGPDLHSWSEEAAVETDSPTPSENGITELVTVRDTVPLAASPRRYGRIRVHME